MSLPTRATANAAAPWTAVLPGDASGTKSRAAGPVFSALLDLHVQAAPSPSVRTNSPTHAPAPTARAAEARAPQAQTSHATSGQRPSTPAAPAQARPGASSSDAGASGEAATTRSAAAAAFAQRKAVEKQDARASDARRIAKGTDIDDSAATANPAVGAEATATAQSPELDAPTADGMLQAWLGWQPPTTRPDGAAGHAASALATEASSLSTETTESIQGHSVVERAGHGPGMRGEDQGLVPAQDHPMTGAGLLATVQGMEQALAEPAGEELAREASAVDVQGERSVADLPAPMHALSTAGAAEARTSASQPTSVNLGTGPGQADFAETFALQVSQLAKGGIQEATLHLNPAELGSISVQISVDAGQAQVDFSASSAHTRELLGSQLDSLAQSLHQAGLAMTGGQVHDRAHGGSRDARQDASGRGSSGGSGDAGEPVQASHAARTVQIGTGRLDLFA